MSESRLVGHSSDIRTLDERDLASLRPAKQNARRPRKPTVLREVTNGIVCFCGERFGESQALEFMLHLRAEVGETLSWADHQRQLRRAKRARYMADPRNREHVNVRERERERERERRADPEKREQRNARRRELGINYRNRPGYRERKNAWQRRQRADPEKREEMNARKRERRVADPEARQRESARHKANRAVIRELHQTGDHSRCQPGKCRLRREADAVAH